jgi:hypothetical protein
VGKVPPEDKSIAASKRLLMVLEIVSYDVRLTQMLMVNVSVVPLKETKHVAA